MDTLDQVQAEREQLEALLVHRPDPNAKDAEETGECLYCGEPLPAGRRWCNAECRSEWEHEQQRRKQNGQ